MTRLPTPGGDDGTWGTILNGYLAVEHNADGTLKKAADITAAKATADSAQTAINNLAISGVSGLPAALTAVTANIQTASYTLVLADAGLVVEMNSASAVNLTIPPYSSVHWAVGTIIEVFQYGAGQVTVVAGSGVALRSHLAAVKTAAQYATISLRCRAQDEWVLAGDLA